MEDKLIIDRTIVRANLAIHWIMWYAVVIKHWIQNVIRKASLVLIPLVSNSVRLWVYSIEREPIEGSLFNNCFFFFAKRGPLITSQQHDLFSNVVCIILCIWITVGIITILAHSKSDFDIIVNFLINTILEIHEVFIIIVNLGAPKLFFVFMGFNLTFLALFVRVEVFEVRRRTLNQLHCFCIISNVGWVRWISYNWFTFIVMNNTSWKNTIVKHSGCSLLIIILEFVHWTQTNCKSKVVIPTPIEFDSIANIFGNYEHELFS